MRSKINKVDVISIILLLGFACLIYIFNDGTGESDYVFQYNRLHQLINCLKDGNYPDLYYSDLYNVGYGSSFFYGQLTLLIFVPFFFLGDKVLFAFVITFVLILSWLGFRSFAKRFTSNYSEIALVYILSAFFINMFTACDLWINYLNVAFSWFFLSFCVDFFRDKKKNSYRLASVMFWLMINTHLVSSLIALGACVFIFISYFDKKRFKEYFKFALVTFLLCSFWLIRMLWQFDIIGRADIINNNMIDFAKRMLIDKHKAVYFYQAIIPIFGLVEHALTGARFATGYSFFNIFITILVLYFMLKRFKFMSKRELAFLILFLVLSCMSNVLCYYDISQVVNLIWQFPCRYTFYMVGVLLIIAFRNIDFSCKSGNKLFIILFLFSLLDYCSFFSLTNSSIWVDVDLLKQYEDSSFIPKTEREKYAYRESHIINGEYLSETFVFDDETLYVMARQVTDQLGNKYDYSSSANLTEIIVPVHSNDLTLTFPKLFYKGYNLVGENGEKFECKMGYSQFIEADIGTYSGKLSLYYKSPLWLVVLRYINMIYVLCFIIHTILLEVKNDKKIA